MLKKVTPEGNLHYRETRHRLGRVVRIIAGTVLATGSIVYAGKAIDVAIDTKTEGSLGTAANSALLGAPSFFLLHEGARKTATRKVNGFLNNGFRRK